MRLEMKENTRKDELLRERDDIPFRTVCMAKKIFLNDMSNFVIVKLHTDKQNAHTGSRSKISGQYIKSEFPRLRKQDLRIIAQTGEYPVPNLRVVTKSACLY